MLTRLYGISVSVDLYKSTKLDAATLAYAKDINFDYNLLKKKRTPEV